MNFIETQIKIIQGLYNYRSPIITDNRPSKQKVKFNEVKLISFIEDAERLFEIGKAVKLEQLFNSKAINHFLYCY